MSDYRSNFDFRNPDDPFRNDANLDPNARAPGAMWGWVAAAVFLVIVLAVAFGAGHQPGQSGPNVASNTMTPPAATHSTPSTVLPPTATPAPTANNPAPIQPTPAPARPSNATP